MANATWERKENENGTTYMALHVPEGITATLHNVPGTNSFWLKCGGHLLGVPTDIKVHTINGSWDSAKERAEKSLTSHLKSKIRPLADAISSISASACIEESA